MKKILLLALSILTGILLSAGWPVAGFAPILFVAFLPLLYVRHYVTNNPDKFRRGAVFHYAFLAFLVWNSITTWWIYNSTGFGMVMAIFLNTSFMATIFMLAHVVGKKLGGKMFYIALPAFWMAFEYLHLDWDLSWPWLTLGNGFSTNIKLIQWYEYTGVFGGGLWIWALNLMLFDFYRQRVVMKKAMSFKAWGYAMLIAASISVPIAISLVIFNNTSDKGKPANVVVVQPNIDPFNEKFDGMTPELQLHRILTLAQSKMDSTIDYVVAPETALPQGINEDEMRQTWSYDSLMHFSKRNPSASIVIGLSSYKVYMPGECLSETARPINGGVGHFDSYNSAMQINADGGYSFYHKSRLVPGVERMPFATIFKPLEKYALDLGGSVGSCGMQKERTVFTKANTTFKVASVICYESIYGEYITKYVQNGANLIFVITNDGWWGDTPGYRQHCSYSSLRAIETRRSIARSANTGISCFVNQRGEITQATKWWVPASIRQTILANDEITFYVRHGDYIAHFAMLVSGLLLIVLLVKTVMKKMSFVR